MTAAQEWMLEGREKGLKQGLEKGREEGREEGRQEGERIALASTLVQLMRLRFRVVPLEISARVDAATKADLQRWIERILTAETLDDLFA